MATIKLTKIENNVLSYTLGDDAATSTVKVVDKKATINGYGTFDLADVATTKFVADAGLTGELAIEFGEDSTLSSAKLLKADFSKTSGVKFTGTSDTTDITGGAGNDTLIGSAATTSINAGAGNDYIKAGHTTAVNVTLGAGADTLELDETDANKVTLADYNYYQGDVIKATSTVAVGKDGGLTVAGASSSEVTGSKIAVEDNWYAAKVDNGTAITDYFTAVAGNNQNVTKDLSKSTVANKVDATGAKTANITLGQKEDVVSLKAGQGADTIKIGKASGSNTISGFEAKDDVFAIDGVKLAEINLAGTGASVSVNYGQSNVNSGLQTTKASIGSFNINDGNQTHKMAYNTNIDGGTIAYTTYSDADWFVGDSNGKTTLEVGSTTHLHDLTKYKNITNIKVAADAKLDAPISLTGAINKDNKIDAANAKVGVAVWGFSSGTDTIALSTANKAQDTVWFGAGDGTDSISGFKYGTASDSDVLYLKDTQKLKDIKVAYNDGVKTADFTVGRAVAQVATVNGAVDVAQIKLADEKTYKVAGNFKANDAVTIDTDAIDGLDYYAFYKGEQTVNIKGSKDWIVHSLYTDFYTTGATIKAIDASEATGKVTLAAAADIKGGEGTNNIWTYQANTSAAVTAGKGTDIIWFAENADKDVAVTNFEADKDIVKFATAQSLKDIAGNYSFATVSGGTSDAKITGVNNTDSEMAITKKAGSTWGAFTITDANDKAYKALVTTGADVEFSTDVNVYAGMTELTVGGSVEGTVAVRLGKESRGLSSDTYFIDDSVTTFNASNSSATFWVAGNENTANTITGGLTENYLYGGGASADKLKGSVLAKDTFYFGTGDGVDEVDSGLDTKDTIALWNIADADIANVKVSVDTENNVSVSLTDSSTLKLTDANAISALKNGLTFTSASQTAYTYDSESKTLVKKA